MRQLRGMTDLEAIADAYYVVLRADGREHLAYQTALAVYMTRHPEIPEAHARRIVVVLVTEAFPTATSCGQ